MLAALLTCMVHNSVHAHVLSLSLLPHRRPLPHVLAGAPAAQPSGKEDRIHLPTQWEYIFPPPLPAATVRYSFISIKGPVRPSRCYIWERTDQ